MQNFLFNNALDSVEIFLLEYSFEHVRSGINDQCAPYNLGLTGMFCVYSWC